MKEAASVIEKIFENNHRRPKTYNKVNQATFEKKEMERHLKKTRIRTKEELKY